MPNIIDNLERTRKAVGLSQEALATRSGMSRKTIQRTEAQDIDPRLSSVLSMAKALGMELVLVPAALRPDLEEFVRSGGRYLGQPVGAGAPLSIIDEITRKP